ncbi:hypothetical protein JCM10908_003217, partial [Rhodotorula pacifica]|uniref:uncharacterized protein n=1 Tax=Rhodotorula pacifica TaxID=1495444 RepID=UPI00316BD716
MQELKSSLSTLSTRLSTLESAVSNRFAVLPLDSAGPPPPAGTRTYASAAAAAPAAPVPAAPAPAAPPPAAPKQQHVTLLLRTSALADTHPLRVLPSFRLLGAMRLRVSSISDPSALLRADRLDSGDVRVVARSALAATALASSLAESEPTITASTSAWQRSVVLHFVPFTVTEAEVESGVEDALGKEEGKAGIAAMRWLSKKDGKTSGSFIVELENIEDVSILLAREFLALRHGFIHASVERARSPKEREARKGTHLEAPIPLASTPRVSIDPPPASPDATLPEGERPPTKYGDLGSGNLVDTPTPVTPTVVDAESPAEPVESSSMDLVTPSRSNIRPLESPKGLPSISFASSEPSQPTVWASDTEEAICAMEEEEADDGDEESEGGEGMSTREGEVARTRSRAREAAKVEDPKKGTTKEAASKTAAAVRAAKAAALQEEKENQLDIQRERRPTPHPAQGAQGDHSSMSVHLVSYNLHKEVSVAEDFLSKPSLKTAHVLLLQEPPSALPATPGWRIFSPPPVRDSEQKTHLARAITLVSDKLDIAALEQVRVDSLDIVVLDLRMRGGQLLRTINVYNPAQGSPTHLRIHNESVRALSPILAATPPASRVVVAGDFNLHHQEWEPMLATAPTEEALEAALTFRDAGLVHLLPPGTATYRSAAHKSLHCNDLILSDLRTEENMISCGVDDSLDAQSDHRPLRLVLDLAPAAAIAEIRRAFRRADPDLLRRGATHRAPEEDHRDRSPDLASSSPPLRPSVVPDAVADACRAAKKAKNVAWRKARRGDHDAEEAVTKAKALANRKKALMRREKARWERREIEDINESNLWRKYKEANGSAPAQAPTPPLRSGVDAEGNVTYASSPAAKLELLRPILLPQVAAPDPDVSPQHRPEGLAIKMDPALTSPSSGFSTLDLRESSKEGTSRRGMAKATLEQAAEGREATTDPKATSAKSAPSCADQSRPAGLAINVISPVPAPTTPPSGLSTPFHHPSIMHASSSAALAAEASEKAREGGEAATKPKATRPTRAKAKAAETTRARKATHGAPASLQGEKVSSQFIVSATLPRLDGVESRLDEDMDAPADPNWTTLDWPDLREDEVESALFGARPYSAAGSDGVPFVVLQQLWPVLRERLLPLYAASLRLGHLPRSWRDAVGIVLRKPKKGDYSLAKAYRLIAFEKTSAKVLEAIVAQRLAYLAESHQLLPKEHFGGRQGRSVDESITCFVDEIKSQWRNGNVVVGIALDVAKAFPSVDTDVLCAEMRGKGLPSSAVSWIRSFMTERTCDLRLEGVSSGPLEWRSGLPQGSPLSPILYLYYNAPALAALQSSSSMALGWVDDINLLVWGKSAEAAVARANELMPALEEWSTTHLSAFEPSKSDAVLYAPHNKKVSANLPDVVLAGSLIPWSPSLTMLGTIIDEKLTFDAHVAACASKAATALMGVRLLSDARGFLHRRHTTQLIRSIVFPRLDWTSSVWFSPSKGKEVESSPKLSMMEKIHRSALVAITGAYKSAAISALEVEANVLPLRLRLRSSLARLGLRAAAAHRHHPLAPRLAAAQLNPSPAHPSPLHHALRILQPILPPPHRFELLQPHAAAPWDEPPRSLEVRVAGSKDEAVKAHTALLDELGVDDIVAYSDGSLMAGVAGSGVVLRAERGGKVLWAERSRGLGQHVGIYEAELEGIRIAMSCAPSLLPADYPCTFHILADNQAAVANPLDPRPTPGQSLRLALRTALKELAITHPGARIVVSWIPGHVGVEGNEKADDAAKEAVLAVTSRMESLAKRRAAEQRAKRSGRALAYKLAYDNACTSDGSEDEEEEAGKDGGQLGRQPSDRPAISPSPPANSSGEIRHGRLLPRSISAGYAAVRAAQLASWASMWATSPTGAGLRAISSSPPGPAFTRYHASLSRRQSSLLTRLRTGACDLGAYKQHFEHDEAARMAAMMCACGGEPETREHFLLHCPRYAAPRAELFATLRLKTPPTIAYLLGEPRATKATL